jgi:alkylresorcinol/alkylpyrone synthase
VIQLPHDPRASSSGIAIRATATALPPYEVTREDVKLYLNRVFPLEGARLDAMMAIVDNSQVRRRYCIHPVDYIIEPRALEQISKEYQEHAIRLGLTASREALGAADLYPQDVDLIVTVSCTGVMIPSLDAHLINAMGFRSNVRRLPITELGCAAGAAALTRAWDFLRANPGGNVLVVAVELPSLTFQRNNLDQANLISSILFGDGAAAAVISGGLHNGAPGPHILDSESYLFPDSIDAMGFDLKDTGFHIVLSKDVPQMIREKIGGLVRCFLDRHCLERKDISAFVLHPGGQKLLLYMEEELGLSREDTQDSWRVLGEYGNLSSASVLFVLHELLRRRRIPPGEYGLLAAFGPGFSAEMLLLQWT